MSKISIFKSLAEKDIRDEELDDIEEYDLEEYYDELMEDIKEDLEDLREIAKQLGLKNAVTAPLNDVMSTIGSIDDDIKEALQNDTKIADEENEGKW